jgi:calcineurin-like phosphoesterase family protein
MGSKNYWFTSDTHFYHGNIIKYCNRPFRDAEEMTEALINNWNKLVGANDIVYHLGDVIFAKRMEYGAIDTTIRRLKGQINLIMGNHDEYRVTDQLLKNRVLASVSQVKGIYIGNQHIWLSHYPHISWPSSSHGTWMLHGHTHGNLLDNPNSLIKDVGVDSHFYKPVSFETLREIMQKKEIKGRQL